MDQELKEKIARNAASGWCRCFKCDGIVNATGNKCDKELSITCHQWYDGYRTALLALDDERIKLGEEKQQSKPIKVREKAAIAALPECIKVVQEVLLRGGSIEEITISKQVAKMATQYADALVEELKGE